MAESTLVKGTGEVAVSADMVGVDWGIPVKIGKESKLIEIAIVIDVEAV